jgi:hypothetical protein
MAWELGKTLGLPAHSTLELPDPVGGADRRRIIPGGGWTDASNQVYYIAASRVGKKGVSLRDGVVCGNWYNEKYNDPTAHAEAGAATAGAGRSSQSIGSTRDGTASGQRAAVHTFLCFLHGPYPALTNPR